MPKNEYKGKTRQEYYKDYISQPEHISRQKKYKQNMRDVKKLYLNEAIGDTCSFCGSTERLELDHINPSVGLDRKAVNHRGLGTSHRHLKTQLSLNNLRWLCYSCHREHSRKQQNAAWKLFISLPLDEQEKLL